MQTLRLIDRLWNSRQYPRLAHELLAARPEFSLRLVNELSKPVPIAALALIRLDELAQSHNALNPRFIRTILAAQQGDGGWGDPLLTALCLRALLLNRGQGPSIQAGLQYLANLQKDSGLWPSVPIRRADHDFFVSAYILFILGDQQPFRLAVRFNEAVAALAQNEPTLDPDAQRLWHRASPRCRQRPTTPLLPIN